MGSELSKPCETCICNCKVTKGYDLSLDFTILPLIIPLVFALPAHVFIYHETWRRLKCSLIYSSFFLLTWIFFSVRVLLLPIQRYLIKLWERKWSTRIRIDTSLWRSAGQGPLSLSEVVEIQEALDAWARKTGPGYSSEKPASIAFSFSGCSWLMWYHLGVARALQSNVIREQEAYLDYINEKEIQQQDMNQSLPDADSVVSSHSRRSSGKEHSAGKDSISSLVKKQSIFDILQGGSSPTASDETLIGNLMSSMHSMRMTTYSTEHPKVRNDTKNSSEIDEFHADLVSVEHVARQKLDIKFMGSGCGAVVACVLAADIDVSKLITFTQGMTDFTSKRFMGPIGAMSHIFSKGLRELLPPNSYKKVSGILYISITILTPTPINIIVSRFHSDEHLIQALLASCYIPVYYETPQTWGGKVAVDGGITNNVPKCGGSIPTVQISPYPGESPLIGPPIGRDRYPKWMSIFPGSLDECKALHDDGFTDAMAWIEQLHSQTQTP